MERIRFAYYDESEFDQFLRSLPKKDAKKLVQTIMLIEESGLDVAKSMKWVKKLEKNLYEIRSKFGSNIQRVIYFQLRGDTFVITHGFTKKTNSTPEREKAHGRKLRAIYLKQGGPRE